VTKPTVVYGDAEVRVRELLTELLTELLAAEECTVAIGMPRGWTVDAPLHVEVAWDGTPVLAHPVVAFATIRVTVHGADPTPVKDLAALAQGLLLAERNIRSLTGLAPVRDPDGPELASFTVRVATRSTPVETGS
jgi:hypothetical protein